ncbi:L-rhamnose mutarotase [Rhizobium sp. L1K21]|uniref:L-rhamnose mutarotase n=1 Tax=Rhizobium sp. L1K21 TaxID=2954933 RepID=UPI0020922C7C|nr:L-rhamnose mutarotase [Rhizobium sp. L1K21]MCO6188461.1 L-rhamnose mutarotase [Rhizobium sp. L1K21]
MNHKGLEKYGFKMKLTEGMAEEYKRRHDDIWPELVDLLRDAGVSDYSIFLDEDTNILFGVLWRRKDHTMADLPHTAIMQKWWAYMGDIMATNTKNEPLVTDLKPVFHME